MMASIVTVFYFARPRFGAIVSRPMRKYSAYWRADSNSTGCRLDCNGSSKTRAISRAGMAVTHRPTGFSKSREFVGTGPRDLRHALSYRGVQHDLIDVLREENSSVDALHS
jgi:hypothetical protein